jgi:di/tripeptidase
MEAKNWKKEHVDFLLENYESRSFKELSEKMERSIESIRSKLKRMGLSKDPKKDVLKNTIIEKSPIGKASKPTVVPATKKRRPKVYESASHDLNKMIPVQIDDRTVIYIKAGKDPAEARQKYLDRMAERPKF